MSSIKDKLKSKIKSRIQQPETMQSFDQNSVNVIHTQGKTQLIEIKLLCQWNNKINMKNPKLKCRWYNRTQNNLQEIVGVDDQNYQPSIIDVGSIIEITCEPELPGITYEGMPIQLKTMPIALAQETEKEATQLVNLGKAKFFIQLRDAKIKGKTLSYASQSMIKIDGYKMVFCQMKFGQMNDDIIKETIIDEAFPQININRRLSREISLKFNEEESCLVNFKNHQVRDVFCLLNKLMVARLSLKKGSQEIIQKPIAAFEKTPIKTKQVEQTPAQIQKVQGNKTEEAIILPRQQIKLEFSKKQSPNVIQQVIKQSTSDLLQLGNLKQEIKQLQYSNAKLLKQLEAERQKNYNLQNKISQINERLQSSSKNYFELEMLLKASKQQLINYKKISEEKINIQSGRDQELLYYKNQLKLITNQKDKMTEIIQQLTKANQSILEQVQNYRKIFNANQQQKSFIELQNEMKSLKQMNIQLKLRYDYSIQQKDKFEQDLKNSRNLIQQIQAEKKYIQKKYESLTNELSSPSLGMSKMSDNKSNGQNSLSNSYVFEEIPSLDKRQSNTSSLSPEFDIREKQILDLKKQIKNFVEQNEFLRSLVAKQKKNSSKTQLKLQLFQVKKLVNRLSEAMVEKDMCINNLKEINKELNKKNVELANSCVSLKNNSI